jgi:hypothetical protein
MNFIADPLYRIEGWFSRLLRATGWFDSELGEGESGPVFELGATELPIAGRAALEGDIEAEREAEAPSYGGALGRLVFSNRVVFGLGAVRLAIAGGMAVAGQLATTRGGKTRRARNNETFVLLLAG